VSDVCSPLKVNEIEKELFDMLRRKFSADKDAQAGKVGIFIIYYYYYKQS